MASQRPVCIGLVIAIAALLTSCSTGSSLTSVSVVPSTAALTLTGQSVQFKALGTYTKQDHPSQTKDITDQVTWESSDPSVATVSATGLATAVGFGSTSITATVKSSNNVLVAGNAVLNSSTQGGAVRDLTSITIIPSSQTTQTLGETAQYIAIGTFSSAPVTQDVTNQVTWQSSDVKIATINTAGLATAVACVGDPCLTTITAIGTADSGNAITTNSNFILNPAGGDTTLPSLTVYRVGLGTGTVVSSPTGINCGSGASCTGHFTLGSGVTLTATPAAGSSFGGWSANCLPTNAPTCTLSMTDNETVGAIFNQP
jgi:hypothetical protein